MEVFTLCNCNNLTNSFSAHCKQNQIAVANRSVNRPLVGKIKRFKKKLTNIILNDIKLIS